MKTKFIDYIKYCIAHDIEFDAVIGDVDIPCTFSFWDAMEITDYCIEKYGALLNSECEVKYDTTGRYTDSVIVNYDDENVGERFAYAVAGYVSETEYNKLFNC